MASSSRRTRKANPRKQLEPRAKGSKARFTSNLEKLEDRNLLSASPFIGGDLVVYRVGDGSIALTNGGNPIFMDEYSPTGQLVQSIEMPFSSNPSDVEGGVTSPTANPNPIVNAGSATPSGVLLLSPNGQDLSFSGYDVNMPSGLNSSNLKARTDIARDAGLLDINGSVNTSTAPTDFAVANTSAGALSFTDPSLVTAGNPNGIGFYLFSQQIDAVRFAPLGATSSNDIGKNTASLPHFDSVQIYNNTLYGMGTNGKIYAITNSANPNALPEDPTATSFTALAGINVNTASKPVDFFFATLDPKDHGTQPDTLYVTDPSDSYSVTVNGQTFTAQGEILKYTANYDPTTHALTGGWHASGFVEIDPTNPATSALNNKGQVTGLTGYSTGNSVVMYATSGALNANAGQYGGSLFSFTDTSGFDGTIPTGNPTSANSATKLVPFFSAYNEGFRGVAFAPNQAPALAAGTYNFPGLAENPTTNQGQLVSAILAGAGGSTDTAGSHQGIAITSLDQTNKGTWQYSLDNGTSWHTIAAVSTTSALTLASDSQSRLRFVPNQNYNGSASFSFVAWDQSKGTNGGTFDIVDLNAPAGTAPFSSQTDKATQSISYVNQAPTFVRGPSQSVLNNVGPVSIPWATSISPGGVLNPYSQTQETGQSLTFNILAGYNTALFTAGGQPSINPTTGVLSYTPAATANDVTTISVQLHDNGGTANGGQDTSATQTFQIAVTAPGSNQPPVNTIPFAPQTTNENVPLTFGGSVISISDPDNAGGNVQVRIQVSGGTAALSTTAGLSLVSTGASGSGDFTYQGSIVNLNTALNNLVFTPANDSIAPAQITITTNDMDNVGSSPNGPNAKTATDTININITPVNQPPTFTAGGNITVAANGNAYSNGWATNISPGPANESGQSVHLIVTDNNPTAFIVQPSISPTGVLTFTPADGPGSTTTVTVQLQDNGGTDLGGVDTSGAQTFLIQQTAVDLAPVNTIPGTQRTIENTSYVFANGNSNTNAINEHDAISVADPDAFLSQETVTLTVTNGTVTLSTPPSGTGASIIGGLNNSSSVKIQGTISNINASLDGLTFNPTTNFTGTGASGATITIATNDGTITTTSVVNIDVVPIPTLQISELYLNPPGAPDHPNDYVEIRSIDPTTGQTLPNYTIPANTYLVSISGTLISVTAGQTLTNYPAGSVVDKFNLGGMHTGNNGYLVLLENGNTYTNDSDFGFGLVDPQAAVYDNGIIDSSLNPNPDGSHDYSVAIGTGAGFGNNLTAPGSSIVGHSSIFRPNDIDLYKGSVTFMLIHLNDPNNFPLNPGDLIDQPTTPGGPRTGVLNGPEFNSWTVMDAVGATIPTQTQNGDVSYGFINYADNSLPGFTNGALNGTDVVSGFTADYFARIKTNLGWQATDWVGTSGLDGLAPTFGTGSNNNTVPNTGSKRPLNSIGGPNFDGSPPNIVATTPGAVNLAVSNPGPSSVTIDTGVTVATTSTDANSQSPNLYFPGSATVTISGNYNPATDSLSFTNTPFITGSFNSTTGVLTLTGDDFFDDWNAALESVAFNYSGTAVDALHPTRTISFAANNGSVQSVINSGGMLVIGPATRQINLLGSAVIPPIVGGTSPTPLTWTETLPPTTPQVITVAPNLTIPTSPLGDVNRDGVRNTADVIAMMTALTNLPKYESDHSLTPGQVPAIFDTNGDGLVDNRDVQSLITLIANNTGGSGLLSSATVAITGNFVSGEDLLGWDATVAAINGIAVTQSAHSKSLTLASTTSGMTLPIANFQAVLRTVTYSNISENPTVAQRTITFSAIDSNQISSSITPSSQQAINIVAVNNPPTVTTSPGTPSYTAGSAAILADPAITVTDPDSATLTGARVVITSGFASGDTLGFVSQLGITGSYDSSQGILLLSGAAIPSDYQIALRSVTFSTSAGAPLVTRTLAFTATDGAAISTISLKQISVAGGGGGNFAESLVTAANPLTAVTTPSAASIVAPLVSQSSSSASLGVDSKMSTVSSSLPAGPQPAAADRWFAVEDVQNLRHSHRHNHSAGGSDSNVTALDKLLSNWS